MDCNKYPEIENKQKTFEDVKLFCSKLKNNKVTESKNLFKELPLKVQCLFLYYSWDILSNKQKYSKESYTTAFYLFKLFQTGDLKKTETFNKYLALGKELKEQYTLAKTETVGVKTKVKKNFNKNLQKYEAPSGGMDPLYIYYTTLYQENPNSKIAIKWLAEHGLFEGEQRIKLEEQYKNLKK